jgi:hypothetical protein
MRRREFITLLWPRGRGPRVARPGGNTGVFLRQRGLMSYGVDNTAGSMA